jgi:hypothetical protein
MNEMGPLLPDRQTGAGIQDVIGFFSRLFRQTALIQAESEQEF